MFLCLTLLVAVAYVASAALPGGGEPPASANETPPRAGYDSCTPDKSADRCASGLRQLSTAGVTVVQNMGVVSQATNLPNIVTYANTAHRHGVRVIWNLPPSLSDADLAALVSAMRSHRSTWGYYIPDGRTPNANHNVAAFAAKVKRLDPEHHQRRGPAEIREPGGTSATPGFSLAHPHGERR